MSATSFLGLAAALLQGCDKDKTGDTGDTGADGATGTVTGTATGTPTGTATGTPTGTATGTPTGTPTGGTNTTDLDLFLEGEPIYTVVSSALLDGLAPTSSTVWAPGVADFLANANNALNADAEVNSYGNYVVTALASESTKVVVDADGNYDIVRHVIFIPGQDSGSFAAVSAETYMQNHEANVDLGITGAYVMVAVVQGYNSDGTKNGAVSFAARAQDAAGNYTQLRTYYSASAAKIEVGVKSSTLGNNQDAPADVAADSSLLTATHDLSDITIENAVATDTGTIPANALH